MPSLISLKGHIHLQGKRSLTFSKVQQCFAVTESCCNSAAFAPAAQNHYILFLSQQLLEEMPLQGAFSGSSQFLTSPWPQDKANAQFYLGQDHLHDPENVGAITRETLQHPNTTSQLMIKLNP